MEHFAFPILFANPTEDFKDAFTFAILNNKWLFVPLFEAVCSRSLSE
jgi:hypothetical protein